MVMNLTDNDDTIAVSIAWDPPSDPNGIIRYYRIQYYQISDPLSNDGRRKRNEDLDGTMLERFVNITSGSDGPDTNVELTDLG